MFRLTEMHVGQASSLQQASGSNISIVLGYVYGLLALIAQRLSEDAVASVERSGRYPLPAIMAFRVLSWL